MKNITKLWKRLKKKKPQTLTNKIPHRVTSAVKNSLKEVTLNHGAWTVSWEGKEIMLRDGPFQAVCQIQK